jgi:hypothetical protein
MYATVHYNWEDPESFIDEDGVLSIQFPEREEQSKCVKCDEVFTDESEAVTSGCPDGECVVHTGDENCDDHDCSFPHELTEHEEAFSWVNSASIHLDEEKDQIDLAISLGDPRGAFVMRVYRMPDGQIRMEVPHPKDWFLHLPLRPMGQGGYVVNETEPEESE